MRLNGWEARLAEVLRLAGARPFHARKWNCVLFSRDCVKAVTGAEIPLRWHGTIEATVDANLPRIELRQALRGDVVLVNAPEPTLGVCIGRYVALVGASGLMTKPMSQAVVAWSV